MSKRSKKDKIASLFGHGPSKSLKHSENTSADSNSDVYNPLKAITVLLYGTTDQGLGI
jgi:hypothetical protein